MIRAIAAIDDKRGIAAHGAIPWDIPQDKQYFREKTGHDTVLMGYKTYQEFDQPLPDRHNLVVSRHAYQVRPGFELVHSLEQLLQAPQDDIWVIGGAGLYEAALDYCDELYLTHITGDFQCDRYFPVYEEKFTLKSESTPQTQNGYNFRFAVYTKNR